MLVSTLLSSLALACLPLSAASPSPENIGTQNKPQCSQVAFRVSATADNAAFVSPPDPNNATEIVAFMNSALTTGIALNGTQRVSGDFTIHGVYCKPTKNKNKHPNTLQVLVHGITYNSTMWSGLGFGDRYNWHAFANDQGYSTLAIDRLGHGLNSRAVDPLNVIQPQMHVETIHQIIQAVRTNAPNNALGRGFSNVVYIGHSYGSMIGSQLARAYPNDATALVLTGYSTTINFTASAMAFIFEPAVVHDSTRFRSVPLGYVTQVALTDREAGFYGGDYDHGIPPVDFAFEDITTDGEYGGLAYLTQTSPGYRNPIMLVTGVQDAIFCTGETVSCEKALTDSGLQFPDRGYFEIYAPARTGHDLTLHYSAGDTFARVHQFLDRFF